MTDTFSKSERSRIMRAVKSKNTTPELTVRRLVHALGYRYRLHVQSLPGSPDLVFASRCKVIFVHGCFWHRHACREGRSMPASNVRYWKAKFERNRRRDSENRLRLRKLGWTAMVVWECETVRRRLTRLDKKLRRFLAT